MAYLNIPEGNESEVDRVWQLAGPALARSARDLKEAIYGGELKLSLREQEAARMRIAQINACPV